MKEMSLEEKQQCGFEILKTFNDICKKNNITYFIAYGTALGAIRHGGFIPWDDDIDVVMPYPDYLKIKNILKNRKGQYKFCDSDIDGWPFFYSKYTDTETTIVKNAKTSELFGIGIDIFPLYPLPDDGEKIEKICKEFSIIKNSIPYAITRHYYYKKPYKSVLYEFLQMIYRRIKYGQKVYINTLEKLIKKGNQLINRRDYQKAKFVTTAEIGYSHENSPLIHNIEVFEKKIFDEITYINFEGREFPVVKNYDGYLKLIYGDYMTLPPENERIAHRGSVAYKL